MYHVKKEGLKGMSADRRADFERNKEYMKPGGEHMQEQQVPLKSRTSRRNDS